MNLKRLTALVAAVVVSVLLGGCAVLDTLLEDDTVHQGTVERVEHSRDKTTVHFDDGVSYEVDGHPYVKPGSKAKITEDAAGNFNDKLTHGAEPLRPAPGSALGKE